MVGKQITLAVTAIHRITLLLVSATKHYLCMIPVYFHGLSSVINSLFATNQYSNTAQCV